MDSSLSIAAGTPDAAHASRVSRSRLNQGREASSAFVAARVQNVMQFEQWLTRLTTSFADRVLSIDARVSDRWGRLNVPDPVPTVDGLLAATALVHDLVLVTRNTRDVERTGARLLDPTIGRRFPA